MRCLYCGKRLALLRKLTDSEFCSAMHRRLYQQEQEKMGLARLMEAQTKFEKYVGVDAAAVKQERKAIVGAGSKTNIPVPQEEPRGFLPQIPPPLSRSRLIQSVECGVADLIGNALNPEANLRLNDAGFSTTTKYCNALWDFPALHACTSAQAKMELTWLSASFKTPPPGFINTRPPSLLPLTTAIPWILTPRTVGHLLLRHSDEPIAPSISPIRPLRKQAVLCGKLVPAEAFAALVASARNVNIEARLSGLALTAFASGPQMSALRRWLKVTEPEPLIIPSKFEWNEDTPPAPPAWRIIPGKRVEAKDARINLHRVRIREAFFPLKRLADLPGLAARVVNASRNGFSGISSRDWHPGLTVHRFTHEAIHYKLGHGVELFGDVPALPEALSTLPRLAISQSALSGLGAAGRTEPVELHPAHSGRVVIAGDYEPVETTTAVLRPALSLGSSLSGLAQTSTLALELPQQKPLVCGSICQAAAEPLASVAAEHTRVPVRRALSAPLDLCASAELRPLTLDSRQGSYNVRSTEFTIVESASTVTAASPAISVVAPLAPPASSYIYRMGHGSVVDAGHPIAPGSYTPLSVEAVRNLPRLRISVVEDTAVHESVRALQELARSSGFSWLPNVSNWRPNVSTLRWAVMSVPVVLLLGVYTLTHKPESQELATNDPNTAATEIVPAATTAGPFEQVKQTIMRRAAISLSDDFRSGLGEWQGRGDWSRSWSYDPSGFLNTGPLALYSPSMSMSDYRLEFLGQIAKKGMGWVTRAKDLENYQATKITLTRNGPLPTAVVEHYAVIGGKEGPVTRRPLPMQVRLDTLYRIQMDVRGNNFTLMVQGQVVDHWSDDRLSSGGVGFFSAKGEQARIRWVEVSHQYDALGRLCAFLAPYSLPAKEGSGAK